VARRLRGFPIGCFARQLLYYSVANEPDNRSDAERLAAYPISDSSDLTKSAEDAKLIASPRLSGHVDMIRRIDERAVWLAGWAADREGDSTPLEVLIFVAGQ
jgi:hypothetical protein